MLVGHKELALELPGDPVNVVCSEASGAMGRGASLVESFIPSAREGEEAEEGANWKDFLSLPYAIEGWRGEMACKLVLIRAGNVDAAACAESSASRSPPPTKPARRFGVPLGARWRPHA